MLAEKCCFLRASDVAHSQSARLLELEAASALATLYCAQGKKENGVAILRPVFSWFTEGFDSRPLREANELLQALAQ
jgi:adenylate cyclase